jgi:hypothetical protein
LILDKLRACNSLNSSDILYNLVKKEPAIKEGYVTCNITLLDGLRQLIYYDPKVIIADPAY